MKKLKIVGLVVVMALEVTACGNKEVVAPVNTPVETKVEVAEEIQIEPVIQMEDEEMFLGYWYREPGSEPEPKAEEKIVLEAELKEEIAQNMDGIERVISTWVDLVTSPDKSYTEDKFKEDLLDKKVIIENGHTFRVVEELGNVREFNPGIKGYTINKIEFMEEEVETGGADYSYATRRNSVPFHVNVTVYFESNNPEDITVWELEWVVSGPVRDGKFRVSHVEYTEDMN